MKAFVLAGLAMLIPAVSPAPAISGTTGSLIGQVRDVAGFPVAGVTVVASSPAQSARTTSDTQGRFCFIGLVPGTYTVTIEKDGSYAPMSAAGIEVERGNQAVVTIHFERRALAMVIRDFAWSSGLVRPGMTADTYSIEASANPNLATSRTIGELLPFVPGVQVIGGSPYPR